MTAARGAKIPPPSCLRPCERASFLNMFEPKSRELKASPRVTRPSRSKSRSSTRFCCPGCSMTGALHEMIGRPDRPDDAGATSAQSHDKAGCPSMPLRTPKFCRSPCRDGPIAKGRLPDWPSTQRAFEARAAEQAGLHSRSRTRHAGGIGRRLAFTETLLVDDHVQIWRSRICRPATPCPMSVPAVSIDIDHQIVSRVTQAVVFSDLGNSRIELIGGLYGALGGHGQVHAAAERHPCPGGFVKTLPPIRANPVGRR